MIPAEDIYVFIHFPDELNFPSEKELFDIKLMMESSQDPERPSTHISFTDIYGSIARTSVNLPLNTDHFSNLSNEIFQKDQNVKGPFIEDKDSTKVSYEITKLIHGFSINLDPVEVIITDNAIGKTFQIPYQIHSSTLPKHVNDHLSIIINES